MSIAALRSTPLDWVFDLDNTLYPADSTMYDAIGLRMTAYIARVTGLDDRAAEALREHYFVEYGATVVGLARHHEVDASHFLTDVHSVDTALVRPDPELRALIDALPGRKFVFTNGGGGHAERMIGQIGLDGIFDDLIDIEGAALTPKPERLGYERMIERFRLDPVRTVFVEDTLRNLMPAAELGFMTVLIGPVHPDPLPDYVHVRAHDLKTLLREVLDS